MVDVTIDPPNSRLFILCSKSLGQDELHEAFEKYGNIEDIWIVKDKNTNESKGVVYIKYAKSSEAALAMEEMNGKSISSGAQAKPIKVMIAHSREQGSRRDDDPERLQRLFIIVPKATTEDELRQHFKQFGDLDYISIVKNKDTGESKGVAYVKYSRAFHAAKAYEECSRSYKAVFARPRESNKPNYEAEGRGAFGGGNFNQSFNGNMNQRGWSGNSNDPHECRLVAHLHPSLLDEQIYRLFDIAPGLVDIRPQANRTVFYGMQKVLVEYNCPPAASHAAAKLNGFEYPIGSRITVKPYSQAIPPGPEDTGRTLIPKIKPENGTNSTNSGMTTISNNELATLTAALAKAEAIIKSGGAVSSAGANSPSGLLKPSEADSYDPTYCSVRLPPPQPLSAPTDGPTHRLFIVCQPGLPSMYALRDIFGRFGSLVEVYTVYGKNCGYVTYANKESADTAMKTLHLQEVCGMRIKVLIADPPRPGGANERKRLRMDEGSDN